MQYPRFMGFIAATSIAALTGCDAAMVEVSQSGEAPSYEEFLANTYREPGDDGVFIVNGDEAVANEKQLREFYDRLYGGDGALIVHAPGGTVARWSSTQKRNLRYCVSDAFGSLKSRTVQAMNAATAAWEAAADVVFVHDTAQDGNCNAGNGNVVFDVRPTSNQPYLARAFFPNQGRSSRNVLIDRSAYGNLGQITLTGILRHELGHVLGFRHEHTRPEAGTCFEDNQWVSLTPYDSASVMHYPQCNGTGVDLSLTQRDIAGARELYGAPGGGGGGGGNPTPPNPGQGGVAQRGSASGSLAANQSTTYEGIRVDAGSQFFVSMTGTGDADLYVRFNQAPTLSQFHCRPYGATSNEACLLDVPAGATTAHIGVHGFSAASYQLTVEWVGPQ